MRAIQVTPFGGPEALAVTEPVAGDGRLVVAVTAAGVNHADVSRVTGTYSPAVELPFVPARSWLFDRPTIATVRAVSRTRRISSGSW
ncbi:hypothetical protein [Kutzneria buriramensis]|uniref:hypothetical protein n=1 Tax=Kutzneria buriramensis TaxID=1045776 RepID=UPI0014774B13|nr:hypothetical protein [Kutzneria buriramensis]